MAKQKLKQPTPSSLLLRSILTLSLILWLLVLASCSKVENEPFQPVQTLSFAGANGFATNVNPLFDLSINGKSCASAGCHLVNGPADEDHPTSRGGRFKLNANVTDINSIEMMQNYLNTLSFINIAQPEASVLLLEPLAGTYSSVGSHGGGDLFISTDDDNYLRIYQWIANPVDSSEPL